MSEETQTHHEKERTAEQIRGLEPALVLRKLRKSWGGTMLEIGSRLGIILAVIAFFSEYSSRHVERTHDMLQQIAQQPPSSDAAAMAMGYLNQQVSYPLCPLKNTCSLRDRMSFDNYNLYDKEKDEGIEINKNNLKSKSLKEVVFNRATLRKIVISEINLERATFQSTNLTNSQFLDVNLNCSRFINSDLSGAIIAYKDLKGAEFINTNISNVTIAGSEEGNGLTEETFAAAWVWEGQEPAGLEDKYRTYAICARSGDAGSAGAELSKPATNCSMRRALPQLKSNSCEISEANHTLGSALDWIDLKLSSLFY